MIDWKKTLGALNACAAQEQEFMKAAKILGNDSDLLAHKVTLRIIDVFSQAVMVSQSNDDHLEKPVSDRFMGRQTVARMMGVKDNTIKKWVKKGAFPAPFKIGSRVYWNASDVHAWLEEKRNET